jgi:hypothetical protein
MDLRAFTPTVWGFSCIHVLTVTTFGMYKFEFIPELAMFGIAEVDAVAWRSSLNNPNI